MDEVIGRLQKSYNVPRALNNQKSKNLDKLYTNLQKFWYDFSLKKCKKHIGSMHQRCVEVIKKKELSLRILILLFFLLNYKIIQVQEALKKYMEFYNFL